MSDDSQQRRLHDLRASVAQSLMDIASRARGAEDGRGWERVVEEVEGTVNSIVNSFVNDFRPDLSDWNSWIALPPNGWEVVGNVGIDSGNMSLNMGDGGEYDGFDSQVTIDTGWGDGGYDVEVLKTTDGRTAAMRIIFIEDGSPDIFCKDMFRKNEYVQLTKEQAIEQLRLQQQQGWDVRSMYSLMTGFVIDSGMQEGWLQYLRDQAQEEWDATDTSSDEPEA